VKTRYVGVCRGCGGYTQPRNGKGDAYAYCKRCRPGAIQRKWTRERVIAAIGAWWALRPATGPDPGVRLLATGGRHHPSADTAEAVAHKHQARRLNRFATNAR